MENNLQLKFKFLRLLLTVAIIIQKIICNLSIKTVIHLFNLMRMTNFIRKVIVNHFAIQSR